MGLLAVLFDLDGTLDAVLAELAARRIALGIVTNKPGWLTEPLLKQLGLREQFACVISGDSLSERKPHPMPMLQAAKLAGAAPEDLLGWLERGGSGA